MLPLFSMHLSIIRSSFALLIILTSIWILKIGNKGKRSMSKKMKNLAKSFSFKKIKRGGVLYGEKHCT
jgi:hypothetical protein